MWLFRFQIAGRRQRRDKRPAPPLANSARLAPDTRANRAALCLRTAAGAHSSWGYHAEELLFHTSRYYAHTERFLRRLSGVRCFRFGAYRAQKLEAERKQMLARLLQRRAGRTTARAVIELMEQLAAGKEGPAPGHPYRPHAPLASTAVQARPYRSPVPAQDPLLNIADRFAVPVRRRGQHLWIPFGHLVPLLDAPDPRLRNTVQDAIERLHDSRWHLHNASAHPER